MTRLRSLHTSQYLALFLAVSIIPLLIWLVLESTRELNHSRAWVEHTYNVLNKLSHLRISTQAVESSRRGYLITQQDQYLRPYSQAKKDIPVDLSALKKLTEDNLEQAQRLEKLNPLIRELLILAKAEIETKNQSTSQQAETMIHAKYLIDQIKGIIEELTSVEEILLSVRSEDSLKKSHQLYTWLALVSLGFLTMLGFAFWNGQREIGKRRRTEEALLESQAANQMTVRNLSLMGEMTSLLQACSDTDESLDIICQYVTRLLNTSSGGLYLFHESRNQVEVSVSWGAESKSDVIFQPEDCWALRRGESHILDHSTHSIACRHLQDWGEICSVCIPIVAQGNVLGIMHLENPANREINLDERNLAHTLASQIALAMSSMKLRETLRSLSVRDPLTGLFNRRYMEESMQRELATGQRKNRPLGVVILDLDHFKSFNDTFGHDAGDLLLREVGTLLAKNSRAGDIACRFGGEEFVVIFPEAPLNIVIELSEQLRTVILALQLQHFGQSLGQVSASFGVAAFPEHGSTTEELLRAADKALYKAKAAGRNRVEVAGNTDSIR
ncbi:MAG TPA: diguanylate cyclase [Methylophilaceae bacterium]|nr:diguanylate cyclase [Methylophilaceae bacterium]